MMMMMIDGITLCRCDDDFIGFVHAQETTIVLYSKDLLSRNVSFNIRLLWFGRIWNQENE